MPFFSSDFSLHFSFLGQLRTGKVIQFGVLMIQFFWVKLALDLKPEARNASKNSLLEIFPRDFGMADFLAFNLHVAVRFFPAKLAKYRLLSERLADAVSAVSPPMLGRQFMPTNMLS